LHAHPISDKETTHTCVCTCPIMYVYNTYIHITSYIYYYRHEPFLRGRGTFAGSRTVQELNFRHSRCVMLPVLMTTYSWVHCYLCKQTHVRTHAHTHTSRTRTHTHTNTHTHTSTLLHIHTHTHTLNAHPHNRHTRWGVRWRKQKNKKNKKRKKYGCTCKSILHASRCSSQDPPPAATILLSPPKITLLTPSCCCEFV
jgi:hypothetical protein